MGQWPRPMLPEAPGLFDKTLNIDPFTINSPLTKPYLLAPPLAASSPKATSHALLFPSPLSPSLITALRRPSFPASRVRINIPSFSLYVPTTAAVPPHPSRTLTDATSLLSVLNQQRLPSRIADPHASFLCALPSTASPVVLPYSFFSKQARCSSAGPSRLCAGGRSTPFPDDGQPCFFKSLLLFPSSLPHQP